ncbi:TadE family type IV pilus minor pilin [Microbacterium capsulatum]|uniref:TadE family type IV pilus minor pilin n=1 Tax=Microbacterium capsulatum TaxID=3041921 RepID=A0ABU0XGY3_9MICO|nr:TadE family type IV pilus minor pilin [Microbacterium sp. ASV81]MDQ4214391.1 TadE family type IV pilus minor pilin [Microbacterium sp. ASV81]
MNGRPPTRGGPAPGGARARHHPTASRERGSAAAELAVALPVVVLTLLLGVGVLGAGLRMVTLQDAVADAARILGRGDATGDAGAAVARADPGAGFAVSRSDDLVCVTASAEARILGGVAVPIRATGCALEGGR